jgi:hypothetical protein
MRVALPLLVMLASGSAAAQVAPPAPARTLAQSAPSRVGAPLPPQDWSALPQLRYQHPLPSMAPLSAFVRGEIDSGRCAAVSRSATSAVVRVDMAVLVTSDSRIRRIVPRAIDCVTVEQYASGLVSRLARDNVDSLGVEKDTWFRTTLIFAWPV